MFLPFIKSKLVPPKLTDNYVRREKLSKKLKNGLDEYKKVSLLIGNAGYGKSSLAIDYVSQTKLPYLWYNLNESDTDLVVFINYLVKGLKLSIPNLSEDSLELLISSQKPVDSLHNVIGLLVEELSLKVENKFIIVLDDYQFLRNSETINKALEYFIEYLPENIQLLIISRYAPTLKNLSLLRVRQQLMEIDISELKFSEDEVKTIICRFFDDISPTELNSIYQQTEGWIGIIILLLQAYKTNAAIKEYLINNIDKNQPIFDYLTQEIFEIQEEEIKNFMLKTSLLPVFNKEICQEIGLEDISNKLNYMQKLNLIETGFDKTYKYNPVFKDFLKEKAKESLNIPVLNDIYSKIAVFYLNNHEKEEALEYFLLSSNVKEAEDTLLDFAQELVDNNRLSTLSKYLNRFPEDYLKHSSTLQIYLGEIKRLWGDYPAAQEHYHLAEELAIKEGNFSSLGKSYIYESIIQISQGQQNTKELIDEALKKFPEDDSLGLAFAYNTKGIFHLFNEKISESLNYFETALKYYEKIQDHSGQAKVLHNLGFAYSMLGRFEHSAETYKRCIYQMEKVGKYPHPMTYNNLAIIYNYSAQFNEAWNFAEKALELAQKLQYKREISYSYWTLGMISANMEKFSHSEDYFNRCLSIGLELGDRQNQAYALSGLSELARLQEKSIKALELIEEAIRRRDLPPEDQSMIELLIQKAAICMDLKDFDNAQEILENTLLPKVTKLEYKYYQTHIYFFLALVYENKDGKLSQDYMNKAAKLIKENNYHFFLKQQKHIPEYFKDKNKSKGKDVKVTLPSQVKFYCFGDFKTYREDKLISNKEWSGYKTKLAVTYMLHNPKGVTKEQLANLLYPDTDITRTAINVILSRLRKALEPNLGRKESSKYIVFNEGKYLFNFGSSYWLDTEEFNYLLKEAQETGDEAKKIELLQKIIALYQGDFLQEFAAELWCQIESESYRRKVEDVFAQVSDYYFKKGEYEEIITLSEKEIGIDICNEKAFQRKIRALIAMGNKEEGMKHYKIMKNILKSELGIEPSHESYILFQQLT